MQPLVSVVIPTYRRKEEVIRAIKSVQQQTYKNIEIIIIDDNTTPEYSSYIKLAIKNLWKNNILYLKNKKNLGGALSRNVGIEHSNGKLIAFLDDDDIYLEKSIELKVKKMEHSPQNNLAIVYGWVEAKDENGNLVQKYTRKFSGNCLREALYDNLAATSQWLCKKEALIKVGMFSNVPSQQDTTLLIKLFEAGYSIDYVPEVLSIYYEHYDENRISSGGINKLKGMQMLRNRVRKSYSVLNEKDRKIIEAHHTAQILELAIINKKKKIVHYEVKHLIKMNFSLCIKSLLKGYIKKSRRDNQWI